MADDTIHPVSIIGSGPAGFTAAVYAARANLSPILFAGEKWGGQLMLTSEVENFPGFVDGIQGPELMQNMRKQAERFATKMIDKYVTKIDFTKKPFTVWTGDDEYKSSSVIIATGAETRWLYVPGEQEFIGKGVSSCAPCDAFFFKNQQVLVVGGGDSAMEEALYLAKFASAVVIVHRRHEFRASKIMQERVQNDPKISIIWDTVIEEVKGDTKVRSVILKNIKTNTIEGHPIDGVFVAIGHNPVTKFLAGQVELDEQGYIVVKDYTKTSREGIFVAGDVHDHHYRQAVTASAFGCMAAMDVEKYLAAIPHHAEKIP